MAKKSKKNNRVSLIGVIVAALVLITGYFGYPYVEPFFGEGDDVTLTPTATAAPTAVVTGQVEVSVIDVGQGDSILIQTGAGYMLIDAGTGNNSSKNAIREYLDGKGVTELEYLIFTHPHEDHMGGGVMVLENYTVKRVIMPEATNSAKYFTAVLEALEASEETEVIAPVSGEYYTLGDLTFRILAPNSTKYSSLNDYSVVIRATYGSVSMIFMGDAEGNKEDNSSAGESELEILEKYSAAELQSDFIKIGHHGSDTSSTDAFLDAVSPKIAAISVGEGNTYGHPCQCTLDALNARSISYYRTDEEGTLVFVCDGKTIVKADK